MGVKRETLQFSELKTWNLTTRCSLVSYSGQLYFLGVGGLFYLSAKYKISMNSKREREREREREVKWGFVTQMTRAA